MEEVAESSMAAATSGVVLDVFDADFGGRKEPLGQVRVMADTLLNPERVNNVPCRLEPAVDKDGALEKVRTRKSCYGYGCTTIPPIVIQGTLQISVGVVTRVEVSQTA